jgi:hypothetical protein
LTSKERDRHMLEIAGNADELPQSKYYLLL